jgi:hypothetical protein
MIRIRTTILETRPLDIVRKEWRRLSKESQLEMGREWQEKYLPMHFTPAAYYLYKHQQRTRKYRDKKRKLAERGIVEMGGQVDNVFSGDMMRMMMNNLTIKPFPTRVTIKMMGPQYISMKPNTFKGSNQPHKAKEITTVREVEAKHLAKVLEEAVTRRIDALRAPRKTEL